MTLPTAAHAVISYHVLETLANQDGVVGTDTLVAAGGRCIQVHRPAPGSIRREAGLNRGEGHG